MKIKPTQEQIDKAAIIMEMIHEAETNYLSHFQLSFMYFDDESDKQIIAVLLNRNKQGLHIKINHQNIVEWS